MIDIFDLDHSNNLFPIFIIIDPYNLHIQNII